MAHTGLTFYKTFQQIMQQALIFLKYARNCFSPLRITTRDSDIYKWKDNQFEMFQEMRTREQTGHASTAFKIKNETFIVFASHYNYLDSRACCPLHCIQVVRKQLCQTTVSSDVWSTRCEVLQHQRWHIPRLCQPAQWIANTTLTRSSTSGMAASSFSFSLSPLVELTPGIHLWCTVKRSWVWPTREGSTQSGIKHKVCHLPVIWKVVHSVPRDINSGSEGYDIIWVQRWHLPGNCKLRKQQWE